MSTSASHSPKPSEAAAVIDFKPISDNEPNDDGGEMQLTVPKAAAAAAMNESESPIHLAELSDGDDANKNHAQIFNEIESELVSLNLSQKSDREQGATDVMEKQRPPSPSSPMDELMMMVLPEVSVTEIKDSMKEDGSVDDADAAMDEVPLNDEENSDTLSPLLIDNHTQVQHQEVLASGHYFDESVRGLNPLARSFMKLPDSSESFEAIDVDAPQRDVYELMSSDENKEKKSEEEIEQPMEIPDDETCVNIVEQVEFYFSDESLLKDAFLLKHVRRNKEGFVSLKLVSSFKRVRQVCKDWRAVGYAIKKMSKKIELNDLETKIRRLEPLPEYDETMPSRTIVATGLPYDKLTIERVSDVFSRCGEIALIRILRPGTQIPADVRQFMNKHPELLEGECALVEFTESSSARIAQRMEGLYVLELQLPKKKTGKKTSVTKLVEQLKYSSESENERSRGGGSDVFTNNRFIIKRNSSSAFYTPSNDSGVYVPPQRRLSFGNENNPYEHFSNRKYMQMNSPEPARRYSSCSDGYSSCNEMSRRSSMCSDVSRRYSNASDSPMRRISHGSDYQCQCSRRSSDAFRRISTGSDPSRKISTGSTFSSISSGSFDRRYSNASDVGRRISIDSNYDRKMSAGSMGSSCGGGFESQSPRKYSNGFDPFRKLSVNDQYYNGRRISTDSGYDRRLSFGSDSDSQMPPLAPPPGLMRTRNGGFLTENVVRSPIGPDGDSKGFGNRARRSGQVIPPV